MKTLPIHLGGTISSKSINGIITPVYSFEKLLYLTQVDTSDICVAKAKTPFGRVGIDSSWLNLKHIQKIAKIIIKNYISSVPKEEHLQVA